MALRNRNPETLAATSRAVADNHPSSGISYPAVQPFQGVMAERSGNSMPVTAGPVVQGYFTWNRGAFRYEQYDMRFWQDSVAILGGASYILEEELKATFGIAAVQRFALGLQSEDDTDITQDAEMQAIINMINNRRRYGATQPVATQPSDRFQTPTHTSFSTVTHNIEKLGASTTHRGEKSEQEGRVLDLLQPDIMTQQEVTRPDLLTNDLRNNRQVSGQYEALEGAKFQSGTYMENYTMQYNTGSIPFVPGLFYIDPSSGDIMPYTGPMSFGKQAAREQEDPDLKQARPNTFWEVQVPVSRLRPAYKHTGNQQGAEDYAKTHSNLRHRSGMQMVRLRLVNVHTSPGKNTPTINQQVNGILEDMETLQEDVHNTLASGDFYMEKKSKRNWKRLHSGTGAFKSLDPGVNTNYVYGQGKQTADHAVVPMDWTDASSHAIPPLETDDTPQSAMERGRDESE